MARGLGDFRDLLFIKTHGSKSEYHSDSATSWRRHRFFSSRRGSNISAQGRVDSPRRGNAALGRHGITSQSPVRAKEKRDRSSRSVSPLQGLRARIATLLNRSSQRMRREWVPLIRGGSELAIRHGLGCQPIGFPPEGGAQASGRGHGFSGKQSAWPEAFLGEL